MLVIVPFDGLSKKLPGGTILLFDGDYAAPLRLKRPALHKGVPECRS
jgi:hypothetical protein